MASSSAEYIPKKEMEDLTVIDVLKIADGIIKLVDQLDVFKVTSYEEGLLAAAVRLDNKLSALMLEDHLGGRTKVAQLVTDCREVKKFAMRILRRSLSELLPVVAMEEDILDNIIGYLNPLVEDANVDCKFVETTEEDKTILTSIYRLLCEVYSYQDNKTRPLLRDQLQEILAEIKEAENQGDEEGQNQ